MLLYILSFMFVDNKQQEEIFPTDWRQPYSEFDQF